MEPNTNPETGIRYGIISANSLKPDVIEEIQQNGRDIRYEENKSSLWDDVYAAAKDYLGGDIAEDLANRAADIFGQNWDDDEPIHEFELDGVKGRTTWLGGALLVYIFESPILTQRGLCSPCVPNCGDLDSKFNDEGGYTCYDVPPDWREEE